MGLCTICGLDVIHDVNVNVVQDDGLLCEVRTVPEYTAEDNSRLRRRPLDRSLDALETVRRNGKRRRPLYNFQVTKSCEVKTKVLEGAWGLIDQEDIEEDVKSLNLNVCLRIYWVRESCNVVRLWSTQRRTIYQ